MKQNVDLTVAEGSREIATFNTPGVSFEIVGGNDASFFVLNDTKLFFKRAQNYLDGGNNSFNVEISATDDARVKNGRLLLVTVNVIKSGTIVVTEDTSVPIFTTPTVLSMETGTTTTIAATDASLPITYALTTVGSGFTLNGTTLTAPATATPTGIPTNLTITATDSATTPHTATLNIAVTVTTPTATGAQFSGVEDRRVTWAEANNACNAMLPQGTWTLPTIAQYRENSDDLLATITFDSDNNNTNGIHFTSVLWSSTDADVNTSKMGWGYFQNPAVDTAQPIASPYYFTCVKR